MRSIAAITGCSLSALLGAFWIFVALAKAWDLLVPAYGAAESWADRFSPLTIGVVVLAELYLGILLSFRPGWRPISGALCLLCLFVAALLVWPIKPQQSCGCAGNAGAAIGLDEVPPLIRIAFLASLHVIALALLAPARHSAVKAQPRPV